MVSQSVLNIIDGRVDGFPSPFGVYGFSIVPLTINIDMMTVSVPFRGLWFLNAIFIAVPFLSVVSVPFRGLWFLNKEVKSLI